MSVEYAFNSFENLAQKPDEPASWSVDGYAISEASGEAYESLVRRTLSNSAR